MALRKLEDGGARDRITLERGKSDRCGRHWEVGEKEVINEGVGLEPGGAGVLRGS